VGNIRRWWRGRPRARAMYLCAAGVVVAGTTLVGWASASSGATVNNDGAAMFSVSGTDLASTALFDLTLPSGAACSTGGGNGTQYVSFLVPASTNLAALTDTANPTADSAGVVDQGIALANAGGFVPFEQADTTPAGQIESGNYFASLEMDGLLKQGVTVTGAQIPLPNSALIPTGSTTADYEAGVVCFSPTNAETDYWSVPLTFSSVAVGTGSGEDPNGFVWTPGTGTTTTTTTAASSTTSTSTTEADATTTTVAASGATQLVLTVPTTATAGVSFSFTVNAEDADDSVVSGFADEISFTSSDSAATLPAATTLSNGTGSFTATFNTDGDQTITATDATTGSIIGTSTAVDVTGGSGTTSTTSSTTSTTLACATATTSTTSPTTTSSTTSTSSTTVPCTTTSTTTAAATSTTATSDPPAVVVAAAGSAAPSAGADPAAGDATDGTALPYTGQRATPELLAGICLIGIGLLLLAAARRRQELERLVWPDQR